MKFYRRVMGWFSAKRSGTVFLRWLLPKADRIMLRLSKGRRTFSNHAIPTLVLTTTGRKSGEPRVQPLCYVRDGNAFVVVGSNWGQEHHPAWTSNLLAEPSAKVMIDGKEAGVEASLVPDGEWERLYAKFVAMSPNYGSYQGWAGDRAIRMFRLTPG